jgi:hypothetical protein
MRKLDFLFNQIIYAVLVICFTIFYACNNLPTLINIKLLYLAVKSFSCFL